MMGEVVYWVITDKKQLVSRQLSAAGDKSNIDIDSVVFDSV